MADQKLTALTLINIAQITDLMYVVTYDADGVTTSVAMTIGDLQKSVVTGVNRIIGGQVVWTGIGFTHRSINLSYEINGLIYFSNNEDITNSAPDGSNPRFDVIFVDADGLDIKEGTPAASPTVPSLDNPTSELATNIVLVTNGETTPTGVTLEAIYSENLQESGGEWDTFENSAGVRIALANTTDPINLTKDIKATAPIADDYLKFNNTTPIAIADFQNLRNIFRSTTNWKTDYMRVVFYDGATEVGYAYINKDSLDTMDDEADQVVFIDKGMVSWVLGETQFDEFRYVWVDAGGASPVSNVRFQVDLIKIEWGGITTDPTSNLSMDVMSNMTNAKTTPIDADNLTLWDSVVDQFKMFTWANLKVALDTLYTGIFGSEIIFNVESYSATGDGIQWLDGAITASDATFTSATASFVAGDVGKVIHIEGAGASGIYHTTTIASFTSGTEVELTDNAATTVSGAVYVYGTENTTFIQAAIQACFDAGGGTVYYPKGIYIINGALQNDIGAELIDYNSQLYIPYQLLSDRYRTSILMKGEVKGQVVQGTGLDTVDYPSLAGTVLLSTITGTGAEPSVICNRGDAGGDLFQQMGMCQSFFENIQVLTTPNENAKTTMGGLNCFLALVCGFKDCTIFPYNQNLYDSAIPDVTDAIGISFSRKNATKESYVINCNVGGLTSGYKSGEHGYMLNSAANCCINGLLQTENNHSFEVLKFHGDWCKYAITFEGAAASINVVDFMGEYQVDSKWFDTVAHINDASDYALGVFNYNIVAAGVGFDNSLFVKIGGENLKTNPISVEDLTNTQSGTTYTFINLDASRLTESTNAAASSFTVPPDSTTNYDIGAIILVTQTGAGQLTIVAGGGVTINTHETILLRTQHSTVAIIKMATNTWKITGDLELV